MTFSQTAVTAVTTAGASFGLAASAAGLPFSEKLLEYGPVVTVVALFLWYLVRKDNRNADTVDKTHELMGALADRIHESTKEASTNHAEVMGELRRASDRNNDRKAG